LGIPWLVEVKFPDAPRQQHEPNRALLYTVTGNFVQKEFLTLLRVTAKQYLVQIVRGQIALFGNSERSGSGDRCMDRIIGKAYP